MIRERVLRSIPLIWSHGLFSSMAAEADSCFRRALDVRGELRVVRYDQRGHGEAPLASPRDQTWEAMAEGLLRLADALSMTRFLAGGESMGAMVSLLAAIRNPHAVEGLFLVSIPTIFDRGPRARALEALAERCEAEGTGVVAALYRESPVPGLAGVYAASADWIAHRDRAHVAALLRGAAASALTPEAIALVPPVPTMIVAVRGDPDHPVEEARQLARRLPSPELVVVDDLTVETLGDALQEFLQLVQREGSSRK